VRARRRGSNDMTSAEKLTGNVFARNQAANQSSDLHAGDQQRVGGRPEQNHFASPICEISYAPRAASHACMVRRPNGHLIEDGPKRHLSHIRLLAGKGHNATKSRLACHPARPHALSSGIGTRHEPKAKIIPCKVGMTCVHDLIVHRKSNRPAEAAIHESHQLGLIIALDVGRLAVLPLVWERMQAWCSYDHYTIGFAVGAEALDQYPAVFCRKMLKDIQRNDRIMFDMQVVVEQ
jgi:hypothetical protein